MTPTPKTDLTPAAVAEAMAYADDWLAFRRRYLRLPGVQAAVWYDGGLALSTAHGLADVERAEALTPSHLFRIASHSKTFTATAVLQLVERGELRLDDRCDQFLPDASDALAGVTVRELLQHTSGLVRDGFDGDFWQLGGPFPGPPELAALVTDGDALVLARNERFKYSNIGYGLLGLVIEAVTGSSYADVLRASILEPLGLTDTGAEYDPARAAEYATGYSALAYAEHRVPIEHVDTRSLAAATGCYATAADLVRYFAAHRLGDTRLLTDDSKRQMQHGAWRTESGEDKRYGLGLSAIRLGDRGLVGHGGGYPGHATGSVFDPESGLVVSVLTNAIDGPAESLLLGVVKLLARAGDGAVPAPPDAQRFTGRFAALWSVVDIALLGGRLFLVTPSAPDPVESMPELEIVDETTLRITGGSGYGAPGERLTFQFADDGSITSVRGPSATTMLPLDEFVLPDRVTVGWLSADP